MYSFDPTEKHQKTFGFLMFSGGSKGNIVKKWLGLPKILGIVKQVSFMESILQLSFRTIKSYFLEHLSTEWAFSCSKLTIETLEQGVKYVQS